ncbi:hypothetical protein [Siphonobacter sp. SORGH_AS_0500]|uniref:hypothetical protein n=1 Tax=Siphonobacter sp. SORGH_AS_0500 TaxID=1864824 RepID=UPI002859E745|nr:hypothetical protein [Siphonobacter sp. SORGH_AS_0500]MDR6194493.1 hypothetical protein [Siphonobacter sp. SORGH_AS_0500]
MAKSSFGFKYFFFAHYEIRMIKLDGLNKLILGAVCIKVTDIIREASPIIHSVTFWLEACLLLCHLAELIDCKVAGHGKLLDSLTNCHLNRSARLYWIILLILEGNK